MKSPSCLLNWCYWDKNPNFDQHLQHKIKANSKLPHQSYPTLKLCVSAASSSKEGHLKLKASDTCWLLSPELLKRAVFPWSLLSAHRGSRLTMKLPCQRWSRFLVFCLSLSYIFFRCEVCGILACCNFSPFLLLAITTLFDPLCNFTVT
jgi:hypothetical protein